MKRRTANTRNTAKAMTEIVEEGSIILIKGDSVEVINAGISKAVNIFDTLTAGVMIDLSGLDKIKPIDDLLMPLWTLSLKNRGRKTLAMFGISGQHQSRLKRAPSITQGIVVFEDAETAAGFIIDSQKKVADNTAATTEKIAVAV